MLRLVGVQNGCINNLDTVLIRGMFVRNYFKCCPRFLIGKGECKPVISFARCGQIGLTYRGLLLFSTSSEFRSNNEPVMNVFDRKTKVKQRDRAAAAEDVATYDYLKDEVAYRLVDRLYDIQRKFKIAVDLGCGRGHISNHITPDSVEILYQCEMSQKMLEQTPHAEGVQTYRLKADEEFLPFRDGSLDLVISNLSLHWVNDLPGTFKQVYRALRNDGVFLASIFGTDTLFELRCALQLAETEREGGFAPHISPLTEASDLGGLLQRAGFTMLTVDMDEVIVSYPSMFELMHDLKGMAESNCSWNRKAHLHRDTMNAAAAIYKEMYANKDGSVPATFRILYLIGWKPDPSQPKPAPRGSGTVSIQDLGKAEQIVKEIKKK